jgi:hypothetical protein
MAVSFQAPDRNYMQSGDESPQSKSVVAGAGTARLAWGEWPSGWRGVGRGLFVGGLRLEAASAEEVAVALGGVLRVGR